MSIANIAVMACEGVGASRGAGYLARYPNSLIALLCCAEPIITRTPSRKHPEKFLLRRGRESTLEKAERRMN